MKIAIVGATGSGKTTLGKNIAAKCHIPHIELDALHWLPNWQPAPTDQLREQVAQALSVDQWVVDGNYSMLRDIIWGQAETLIWLDYSLPVMMFRLWKRTLRRITSQEEIWNSNRESWRNQFMSKDSLFLWQLQTYRKIRKMYATAFGEYPHLKVLHFQSPRAADEWVASLNSP